MATSIQKNQISYADVASGKSLSTHHILSRVGIDCSEIEFGIAAFHVRG
jgi:hypothetical protein